MSTTNIIPNNVVVAAPATEPNGTPSSTSTTTKRTSQKRPLLTRFRFWIKIWLMKSMTTLLFKVMRLVNRQKLGPFLPDYTKRYDVRPLLENRVFIPRNSNATTTNSISDARQKHPLLITIHGGGFALCDPTVDDEINRHFADNHSFVVVSVNYPKSPAVCFPKTVRDTGDVVSSVMADPDLPVDASRGATIAGFSAGGNLALAVSQLPSIKDKIRSVVPFYPVVDFTGLYKGKYRDKPVVAAPDGQTKTTPDMLKDLGPLFDWAYISPGTDLTDPLLSPVYANRSQLPQRIFFVTAEYDYLCHEAEVMARKLAGFDDYSTVTWSPGTSKGSQWEQNNIRWRMVPDVTHSWTHMPLKNVEEEKKRREDLVVLYKEVANWLKQ